MIAVLTEAPAQSEMEDLSFLGQGGVPQQRRGVGDSQPGFSDMLRDIGVAPSTRSVMKLGDSGGSKGAVMIFPIETVRPPDPTDDPTRPERRQRLRNGAKM